jgi:hypothetical protein
MAVPKLHFNHIQVRNKMQNNKYVKHLTTLEVAERLATELIQMHKDTAIDLGYWETALELVERFYRVKVTVEFLETKPLTETEHK